MEFNILYLQQQISQGQSQQQQQQQEQAHEEQIQALIKKHKIEVQEESNRLTNKFKQEIQKYQQEIQSFLQEKFKNSAETPQIQSQQMIFQEQKVSDCKSMNPEDDLVHMALTPRRNSNNLSEFSESNRNNENNMIGFSGQGLSEHSRNGNGMKKLYIYPMLLLRTLIYKDLKYFKARKHFQSFLIKILDNKEVLSMKELIEKMWKHQTPLLQKKIKALAETLRNNIFDRKHIYDMNIIKKYLPEHDLDYDLWPECKKRFLDRKKHSNTRHEFDDFTDPDDQQQKTTKSQSHSQNTRKSNRLEQKRSGQPSQASVPSLTSSLQQNTQNQNNKTHIQQQQKTIPQKPVPNNKNNNNQSYSEEDDSYSSDSSNSSSSEDTQQNSNNKNQKIISKQHQAQSEIKNQQIESPMKDPTSMIDMSHMVQQDGGFGSLYNNNSSRNIQADDFYNFSERSQVKRMTSEMNINEELSMNLRKQKLEDALSLNNGEQNNQQNDLQ